MILIDQREDRELFRWFRPFGINVESTLLEYGDFCWVGNGPEGSCMVGVERKTIQDLISSMRTGRLSGHQLHGMCNSYDYQYLLVEGYYRPGNNGMLEYRRGSDWTNSGVMYREVDSYLATLELKTPMIVHRSSSMQETAVQVTDLYRWWTAKAWDEHHAHETLYTNEGITLRSHKMAFISPEETIRRKYGDKTVLAWKFAAQLPGLDKKAERAAIEFRTATNMVLALPEMWMRIEGIGKVLANRFWDLMR